MRTLTLVAALLVAPLAMTPVSMARAHDFAVGDLTIVHPFIFATPPNAPVAGGYLEITNTGDTDDRLIAARAEAEIAGELQLHRVTMDNGVMRMDQVEGGIPIPAGGTVVLEQGGLHVMFMGLATGLEAGATVPVTLTFEQAGDVDIVFNVEARGARGAADHGEMSKDGPSEHDH